MALDKLVDSAQLDAGLTSIANAIRAKGGTSAQLVFPQGFVSAINAITPTPQATYVQDGLVHYWDGINNTGNGHDSNATSWTDLIGSYAINKTNPGAVWLDNALFFNPASNYDLQAWTGTGSLNPTNTMTIEMVIDLTKNEAYPDGRGGMIGHFASYGQTKQRRIATSRTDGSAGVYCNETNGFAATGFTNNIGVHSIVGTYTTTTKSDGVYINGVAKTKSLQHTYGEDSIRDYVIIGGYDHAGSSSDGENRYPFLGKIYAIRIYNRVLSASEIASNYAVDVTRFGLVD